MIYLIVCKENMTCKIGYTNGDPEKRLLGLQTGNPFKLHIAAVIDGDEKLEAKIHSRYKEYELLGEWFKLSDDICKEFNITPDTVWNGDYKRYVDEPFFRMNVKFAQTFYQLSGSAKKVLMQIVMDGFLNLKFFDTDSEMRERLANKLNISQSSVANAVKSLKDSGLILQSKERRGLYCVNAYYIYKGSEKGWKKLVLSQEKLTKWIFTIPPDKPPFH